jgi:hypothetical protein
VGRRGRCGASSTAPAISYRRGLTTNEAFMAGMTIGDTIYRALAQYPDGEGEWWIKLLHIVEQFENEEADDGVRERTVDELNDALASLRRFVREECRIFDNRTIVVRRLISALA